MKKSISDFEKPQEDQQENYWTEEMIAEVGRKIIRKLGLENYKNDLGV